MNGIGFLAIAINLLGILFMLWEIEKVLGRIAVALESTSDRLEEGNRE